MSDASASAGEVATRPEFGPNSRWTRKEPKEPLELTYLSWDPRFAPPPPKNVWQKIARFFW